MSRTIWKFCARGLIVRGLIVWEAKVPLGARFLHVGMQDDSLCAWAEVESEAPELNRRFSIVGTGQAPPPTAEYLGTVQQPPYVWHIYINPETP